MLPAELQETLSKNNGIITTKRASTIGVSKERLRLLANKGELERVAHGVYILPEEFLDKMYITQLRRPKIIYSHETALFLHDLTDRDPINYTVTVPAGYGITRLHNDNINVLAVKKELHTIGASKAETVFGNSVITYGLERTLCDCVRNRNKMDISIVLDAIKRYVKRSNKDLNTLMKIAEVFRVTKPLTNYLEVLM